MNAAVIFSKHVELKFDYQCPATQDAIDRLVEGEGFRGRVGMLQAMRGANYGPLNFNGSLLSAWTPSDILLATGRPLDFWLSL